MMNQYYRASHLGAFSSYYTKKSNNEICISDNFSSAIHSVDSSVVIDNTAVLEFLNKNYLLGDRTIVENIKRTPWMADIESLAENLWSFSDVPEHGYKKEPYSIIANKLFNLLKEEILSVIKNKKRIGILLSGGMDSRIVAGVLWCLSREAQIDSDTEIFALTWGEDNTRDVIYAKEIAKRYNWHWKHYKVRTSQLRENIKVSAIRGCEFSAVHLHALPQIKKDNELDIILAGSYGDSIGRAEYSGKFVKKLPPIGDNIRNTFGLLKDKCYAEIKDNWKADIDYYHDLFPKLEDYQQIEQDYQLHYMRRMLNPCMEVIAEKIPVYQAFTHPSVFGYMWSLDPEVRTNDIYYFIIQENMSELIDIPWARTGLIYPNKKGTQDRFLKSHHNYTYLINNQLFNEIAAAALSEPIRRLGIFNMSSIELIIKSIRKIPRLNFDYLERLLWLASLSYMIKVFEINQSANFKSNFHDTLNANAASIMYKIKTTYRALQ